MPQKKGAASDAKKSAPKKGALAKGGKGGKAGAGKAKKKWSKGKVREKLNNLTLWDKNSAAKLSSDIPKGKAITIAKVSDACKVNGTLAREGLKLLEAQGLIKKVTQKRKFLLYTKAAAPKA